MATVTKAASSNSVVSTGWTNPTNAYADDTTRATALDGSTSKNIEWSSDYGFANFSTGDIPDNSSITSVTIRCDAYLSAAVTGGLFGNQPYLNGSTNGTEATTTSLSETPVNVTMSGVTLANLRSASSLIKCRARGAKGNTSTALTVYLDYVQISVVYDPTQSIGALGLIESTPAIYDLTASSSGASPQTVGQLPQLDGASAIYALTAAHVYPAQDISLPRVATPRV